MKESQALSPTVDPSAFLATGSIVLGDVHLGARFLRLVLHGDSR